MSSEFDPEALEAEWKELKEKMKGDFVSPKDYRRMNEITSLLMTNGENSNIQFKLMKGRESKRVTSFTRNRR